MPEANFRGSAQLLLAHCEICMLALSLMGVMMLFLGKACLYLKESDFGWLYTTVDTVLGMCDSIVASIVTSDFECDSL